MHAFNDPILSDLSYLQDEFWRWFRHEHNNKYQTMRRSSINRLNTMMLYALDYSNEKFSIEDMYLQLGVESDGYYRKRVDYCSLHDCFQQMLTILELKKEGSRLKYGQSKAECVQVKDKSQLDIFS